MSRVVAAAAIVAAVLALMLPSSALAQHTTTATFVSADGTFTFDYPSTWQVTQLARESPVQRITYLRLGIAYNDPSQSFFWGQGELLNAPADEPRLGPAPVLRDSLSEVLEYFTYDDPPLPFGDMHSRTLGSYNVAYRCTCDDPELPVLYTLAVSFGSGNYFVFEGQLVVSQADFEDAFFPVIQSMRFERSTAIQSDFPPATAGEGPVLWQSVGASSPFYSVIADADDTVFVSTMIYDASVHAAYGGILTLDPNGELQQAVANPVISNRTDVALADDGSLWMTSFGGCQLLHLDRKGVLIETVELGAGYDYCGPQQIEIGADGTIYALHTPGAFLPPGAAYVRVYSPQGEKTREFPVGVPDEFTFASILGAPAGFSFSADGKLYIANGSWDAPVAPSVRVFDTEGQLLVEDFAPEVSAGGLRNVYTAPDGLIYLIGADGKTLYRCTPEGDVLATFTLPFTTDLFNAVQPLTMLRDGSLIVVGGEEIARITLD